MPHKLSLHLAPATTTSTGDSNEEDFDWVIIAAFTLFLMQLGLAFIQSGSVRYQGAQATLIKLVFNLTFGLLVWWLLGYGFAYGKDKGAFLGWSNFAGTNFTNESAYALFFLRTGLALLAATIVSQAAAERFKITSWPVYLIFFLGWIYPIQAHWSLGDGWLIKIKYHDFAGSGAVHLVCGTAALIIIILLKPRTHRFDPQYSQSFPKFNQVQIAIGSILLFALWLFYTASSGFQPLNESAPSELVRANVALNTLLSGALGALVAYELHWVSFKKHSLFAFSRGLIAGVVVVSGACDNIAQWAAIFFGVCGGLIYHVLSGVLEKSKLDDPVDVVAVHFGAGLVGTVLTGLFDQSGGIFYNKGASMLGGQLVGIIVYIAWTAFFTAIPILILKGLGQLRITGDVERDGLDRSECGGEAVHYFVETQEETPAQNPAPVIKTSVPPIMASVIRI